MRQQPNPNPNPDPNPNPNPNPNPEQVRDELKRQHLDEAGVLPGGMPNMPSALLLTVLDARRTLCCATVAHDVSSVACGFADSAVR